MHARSKKKCKRRSDIQLLYEYHRTIALRTHVSPPRHLLPVLHRSSCNTKAGNTTTNERTSPSRAGSAPAPHTPHAKRHSHKKTCTRPPDTRKPWERRQNGKRLTLSPAKKQARECGGRPREREIGTVRLYRGCQTKKRIIVPSMEPRGKRISSPLFLVRCFCALSYIVSTNRP